MITFHPLFGMIPAIILFLALFGFIGTMFQTTFSEGEPFSQYANALSIVETKMAFGVSGCEHRSPTVVVLGKIQNDSPVSWKDVYFEATFFDADANLIDSSQQKRYPFMVAAQDRGTFKLSFRREFDETLYHSFNVRVISAKDASARFY